MADDVATNLETATLQVRCVKGRGRSARPRTPHTHPIDVPLPFPLSTQDGAPAPDADLAKSAKAAAKEEAKRKKAAEKEAKRVSCFVLGVRRGEFVAVATTLQPPLFPPSSQLAEAAKQAAEAAARLAAARDADPCKDKYGDAPLIASATKTDRVWRTLASLTAADVGATVLIRARVHAVRGGGRCSFMVLRQRLDTMQLLVAADEEGVKVSKTMVKYCATLPKETIVDVTATVVAPPEPIASCTVSGLELHAVSLHAISRAGPLPFDIADAARSDADVSSAAARGEQLATVAQDTRLDGRVIDLRVPASQAIFGVQSAVTGLFRETLSKLGFTEIHSPCIIAGASEGGASCFTLDYMGRPACLAQSPQLYKQMALAADFDRVFEITPVFRAEKSFTHRHLTEFTGLDFEMAIHEHYNEALDVINALFVSIFEGLTTRCARELAVIAAQYPAPPLRWLPKAPRLTFAEGVAMLAEAGYEVDPNGDLNTEAERKLGGLVAEKYNTDFFILTKFPTPVRPFYTMPDPANPAVSNSYDVFIRGEEIISGAQRVHDADLLTQRALDCGVPPDSIAAYIDAFRYGAYPHAGAGVGLERVVMLFCGLDNIRKTSLFPRDPKRLTP